MFYIVLFSAIGWLFSLIYIYSNTSSLSIQIISIFLIFFNVYNFSFYFFTNNHRRYIEYRIYSDNIMSLFLAFYYPKYCFYGYIVQAFLGLLMNFFYLNSKKTICNVLIVLIAVETFFFVLYNNEQHIQQNICNCITTILFFIFYITLKNKILLCPENRFKNVVEKTNILYRKELIESISPLNYYTQNLNEERKNKVKKILSRLLNLSNNNIINIGQAITLIKSSLSLTYTTVSNITFIQKKNKKEIKIDSYTLVLILYTIIDGLLQNKATEITIEHNNKSIVFIDNAIGIDINLEAFKKSKLKLALDLLELYNIPVVFSSTFGSGNILEIIL